MPGAAPVARIAGGDLETCDSSVESLVLSDRGIGGTGVAPALADRGIGGTGIEPGDGLGGTGLNPGGIGGTGLTTRSLTHGHAGAAQGTGIIGVLGGLPDLCVDGLRIALDRPASISVDGEARTTETARPGQVASIEASGPAENLQAVRIELRHEVSGPITAVAPAGGSVDVMGQHVLLSARTRLAAELRVGGWVAVSGLRDAGGTIHASRVDAREPGSAVLAGIPRLVDGAWQVRGVPLALPPGVSPSGQRAVVRGTYADGTLRVTTFAEEPLARADGRLRRLVVQGFATVADGKVGIGGGLQADVGPDFGEAPPPDLPVILELDSSPGSLVAVSWHEAPAAGGHAAPPLGPSSWLHKLPIQPVQLAATPTLGATTTTKIGAARR